MLHNDGRTVIKRTMEALGTESAAIRAAQQELMASEEAFLAQVANRFGARVQVNRIHDSLDFNTEMLTAAEWKIFDHMLMEWLRGPSPREVAIEKYGQNRNPIEEEGARIREYLKEEGIPKSPYLEDLKGLDSSRDVPHDRNDVFRYFCGTDPRIEKDSYTIAEVREAQKKYSFNDLHLGNFHLTGDLPGKGTNTGTGLVQYPKEELLREALKGMIEMHDYLAKKINWGASALDAQAIRMMNEAPIAARKALEA